MSVKVEFIEHQKKYGRKQPSTLKAQWLSLQRVERGTGKPVEEVTPDELLEWILEAPYAPGTVELTVSHMHVFHRWGAAMGKWRSNGILEVKAPRVDHELKPSMPPSDVWAYLHACENEKEERVVWLGSYAGTRISEAAAMVPENHLGDRLRFRRTKTRQVVEIPIHPELAPRLGRILESPPTTARSLENAFNKLRDRIGIREIGRTGYFVTSHVFRRTFGTQLIEEDVPLWMTECLMSHKSSSMTMRAYASIPFKRKAAALSKVSYGNGQLVLW